MKSVSETFQMPSGSIKVYKGPDHLLYRLRMVDAVFIISFPLA